MDIEKRIDYYYIRNILVFYSLHNSEQLSYETSNSNIHIMLGRLINFFSVMDEYQWIK